MSGLGKLLIKPPKYDEARMTLEELVRREGLDYEAFTVITEDGYHLTVQHINAKGLEPGSPVAFFQHGLFSSSDTWIHGLSISPAIRAANAGYDVWLGNNRGTQYSRQHNTLDPLINADQIEYFDYSFYELGKYDAPAQIDFVRHKTGRDKITYIGHSQGTSQMFSALSEGTGDLKDKINLFVAICPITNLGLSTVEFFPDSEQ